MEKVCFYEIINDLSIGQKEQHCKQWKLVFYVTCIDIINYNMIQTPRIWYKLNINVSKYEYFLKSYLFTKCFIINVSPKKRI